MSRFVSRAGERVAELAERCAEAGRLSRGRALFRKGSVSNLSIIEGSVTASVRGSQGHGYETTISTAPAPTGVRRQVARAWQDRRSVDDLVDDGIGVLPREIDLVFACDCPDWEEPCKHVVAVFLAFADRVDLDEVELLHWRGIDSSIASGADGTASAAGPESAAVTEADGRTARLSELESLLGDTVMRIPSVDASRAGPPSSTLDPALAEFLGVERQLDPVDVSRLGAPAPLFAGVELGPLADLGPELAEAVAVITARLEDTSR